MYSPGVLVRATVTVGAGAASAATHSILPVHLAWLVRSHLRSVHSRWLPAKISVNRTKWNKTSRSQSKLVAMRVFRARLCFVFPVNISFSEGRAHQTTSPRPVKLETKTHLREPRRPDTPGKDLDTSAYLASMGLVNAASRPAVRQRTRL